MRVVLADIAGAEGFTSKDTVAGGYGSRLRPFSKVTRVIAGVKGALHRLPSVYLAYAAALARRAGHDVAFSTGELLDGDVAIVLSSLVDHRRESRWGRAMRARGVRVGFIGLAAQKLPELFAEAADFIIAGEPEGALMRLMNGEVLSGIVESPEVEDLDALPFPCWEALGAARRRWRVPFAGRPAGGSLPVLGSRSCPEFCTYCPHRIQSRYRSRSVSNILDELSYLEKVRGSVHVVFRDPLFSQDRDRVLALCDGIRGRGLTHTFECETRLDRIDAELLTIMHAAGLRAMSFGVEAVSAATLRQVGRRPIPHAHQRAVLARCRDLGIVTAAFYVLGFLQDDWNSTAATIDYAIALGTTVAQFKLLTPYPATPLWKQMAPLVYEADWQKFDGFTPTFRHPRLSPAELTFLLGAAYTRFYMRPSFALNYCRVPGALARRAAMRIDARVARRHARQEHAIMSRTVTC
jgi:radical SAM superfamily enzyme YgiQ (UPF0313 family)